MRVLLISTSRGDFGHFVPLAQELLASRQTQTEFLCLGTRFATERNTDSRLPQEFVQFSELEWPLEVTDWPAYLATMQTSLADFLEGRTFDVAFLLGDRIELLPVAALLISQDIAIAHLHGGETSLGAKDNDVRHAISKLAQMHFVSHNIHADFLVGLGEEAGRVFSVGALAVDNVAYFAPQMNENRDKFSRARFNFQGHSVLVTFHPVTNEAIPGEELRIFFRQLSKTSRNVLLTPPNQDPGSNLVYAAMKDLVNSFPDRVQILPSLGTADYFSAMKEVGLVVGNSSSGIIDAPILGVTSVDFGTRQAGRLAPRCVRRVGLDGNQLLEVLETPDQDLARPSSEDMNFFGLPSVSAKIVEALTQGKDLLRTRKTHKLQ